MRKISILAAVAAMTAAAPAFAQEGPSGEGRVEVRGGVAWASGASEAVAGVAAGYDFDLGDTAFIGVEGSADKILVNGADVIFGVSGRVGAKVGTGGKVYAVGGYSFNNGDAAHVGAGFQHKIGSTAYGKIEYRRFLLNGTDINTAAIGVGVNF